MVNVWDIKSQYATYQGQEVFDCYIAEALLSEGRYRLTEEGVLKHYGVKMLDELANKQKEKFEQFPKLKSLFYDIELPLTTVLWQMETRGITLDTKKLQSIGEQIEKQTQTTKNEILEIIGFEINLNSSQQVGNYLAEKEGVPLARTKTGKYATNELELIKHQNQFEIIQKLLTYRELSKLQSTYVESLIKKIDDKSRVHTTYTQIASSTGRFASSNPNLQNIPVSSDFGMQIKSCFTSSPGSTLISLDYSQQELRILAHLSEEDKLIDAFRNNRDVHTTTASQIFHVDYDAVTKDQRRVAKTINFGIIYGMSAYGMSESLNIPVEDAEKFIKNFYETFPKIKIYYDNYLRNAKIHDLVETILGRRRYVFEDPRRRFIDNGMRRVLMNYPIQGSAADLMKKAMVEVDKEVLQKYDDIHLLLQIHDDLVFEIKDDNKAILAERVEQIKKIMCNVYPLSVPMDVEVKIGKSWGEMISFQHE